MLEEVTPSLPLLNLSGRPAGEKLLEKIMNLETIRRRVEEQGFVCLDEKTITGINLPLRLSPLICLVWASIGTLLASPIILGSLVPFALLGAILPGHPFDVLYNYGLRHFFGTPALPPYPKPRRFACILASLFLAIAAAAFQIGLSAVGYGFGLALIAAATITVTTGFCTPSFIYGLLFGKPECTHPTNA
jgi:hypothetical protein